MKLFLISQDQVCGYNSYDSAVVAAESEDDARAIPVGSCHYYEWPELSDIACIEVEYLGETDKERGVILASFNAG